jgi:hypothetical protein
MLHESARFVHGDCCPCNIAWKWDSDVKKIELKLFDFDTACEIGEKVPLAMEKLKTTLGKECSWPSNDMIVAETDLWIAFCLGLFRENPVCFA